MLVLNKNFDNSLFVCFSEKTLKTSLVGKLLNGKTFYNVWHLGTVVGHLLTGKSSCTDISATS